MDGGAAAERGPDPHGPAPAADGRVLICGGAAADGSRTATAEVFDPAVSTPAWRLTRNMATARERHTATLLPGGQVLAAGGWDGAALAATEVYDPEADAWTAGPPLNVARYEHAAFLLPAGVAAFVGGWAGETGIATGEVEIFNPAAGGAGAMTRAGTAPPRALQAAALLPSGRIVDAGGMPTPAGPRLATVELISIEALQTTPAGALAAAPQAIEFVGLTAPASRTVSGVSVPQTVALRLLGQASSGPWGAGDLVLTLRDGSRNLIRRVSR